MKTILRLSLAVMLLSTVAIFSADGQRGHGRWQGHGHGGGFGFGPDSCHIQMRVADLADELGLSDKQEKKILDLHYAHMEGVKTFSTKYKNDCVGAREARITFRTEFDDSVKKILNSDQLAKYDEFMDDRRGPHARHGRRRK